jgi:hypothetical protein
MRKVDDRTMRLPNVVLMLVTFPATADPADAASS